MLLTVKQIKTETMAVNIDVGELFASFAHADCKIKKYAESSFIQLWMRDTRTLTAAAKRVPKKVATARPQLKYYSVRYCCIHGGQAFRSTGHGHRQTA